MKILDRYYFYEGDIGSNSYLIDAEELTLVDPGLNIGRLLKEMKNDGFNPNSIALIVNTHCHPDHTGGDEKIVKRSGAKVLMHEIDAKMLGKISGWTPLIPVPFVPEMIRVDAYLGDVLDLGDIVLDVIHTPGHSAGSVCLYDEERRVLISGDTAFAYAVGRWDLPGGSLRNLKRSLEKISSLDVEYLLPGHMNCLVGRSKIKESFNFCIQSL
jgi:glyoxylase-like metal-dependent hydrolase (beta-lactamase superfamily II)